MDLTTKPIFEFHVSVCPITNYRLRLNPHLFLHLVFSHQNFFCRIAAMEAVWAIDGVAEKILEFVNEVPVRAVSRQFRNLSGSFTRTFPWKIWSQPILQVTEPILFALVRSSEHLCRRDDPALYVTGLLKNLSYRNSAQTTDSRGGGIWRAIREWIRMVAPDHLVPLIQTFVDAGVSPHLVDKLGDSPFHAIVQSVRTKSVTKIADIVPSIDLLLSFKADVNIVNAKGLSPLLTLVFFGDWNQVHDDLLAKLISVGADVTARYHGMPILHLAVLCKHPVQVVEALIAAGADRTWLDTRGKTAADVDDHNKYACLRD